MALPVDLSSNCKVSVALPVYNNLDRIPKLIEHFAQDAPDGSELIICHNLDDPQTGIPAMEAASTQVPDNILVKYLSQGTNTGGTANHFAGLRLAGGSYFTWIGDDDLWSDNFFVELAAFMDEDPNAACVTGTIRKFLETGDTSDIHVGPVVGENLESRLDVLLRNYIGAPESTGKVRHFNFLSRREVLLPLARFHQVFGDGLLWFDRLIPLTLVFGGNIKVLAEPVFLKDASNWTSAENTVQVWSSAYEVYCEVSRGLVPLHYVFVACTAYLYSVFSSAAGLIQPTPSRQIFEQVFQLFRPRAEFFYNVARTQLHFEQSQVALLDQFVAAELMELPAIEACKRIVDCVLRIDSSFAEPFEKLTNAVIKYQAA